MAVYLILSMDEAIKIPWVYAHYRKHRWLRNITREDAAWAVNKKSSCRMTENMRQLLIYARLTVRFFLL